MIAAIKNSLCKLQDLVAKEAGVHVISVLHHHRLSVPSSNLSPDKVKAVRDLQSDRDIIILSGDKGHSMVVMNRSAYEKKVRGLLADRNTYKPLQQDPTPALKRRMNSLLLSLKHESHLPPQLYRHLHSYSDKIPLKYGLPKLYKFEVPLHPMISFVDYPLATSIVHLLSPLSVTLHHI